MFFDIAMEMGEGDPVAGGILAVVTEFLPVIIVIAVIGMIMKMLNSMKI